MLPARLPKARYMLADKAYDADHWRSYLLARKIRHVIPGSRRRKIPYEYDKIRYKDRNTIERMFGRLKDRRRIATRYDRCAHTFFSAICIAATVIFYLN